MAKGSFFKSASKRRKPRAAAGALFKQQGASVRGKSRLAEDSDVLAGSGPRRKQAERLEKQSMVSDPNYPSMGDVGSQGEKVNVGGQKVLNAVRKRRKINEQSVKDAQKAQEKIQKEILKLEKQVKAIAADKSKTPAKRVADGLKVKNRIKDKKSLMQQAKDKESNALGKTPKKSPRIPRTEMKYGGKITKKNMGGPVRKRVGMASKMTSRKAGGPVRQRYAMATGKK